MTKNNFSNLLHDLKPQWNIMWSTKKEKRKSILESYLKIKLGSSASRFQRGSGTLPDHKHKQKYVFLTLIGWLPSPP